MLNREIAWHLQTVSVLLELNKEYFFKIKAYRNAAREIKRLPRPVGAMLEDGSLAHVEGIGPCILAMVRELVITGHSSLLEELSAIRGTEPLVAERVIADQNSFI